MTVFLRLTYNYLIYMLVGWTTLGKPIGLILILNLIIIFVGLGLSIYYIG